MTINNDCMTVTISIAKYERLIESQTKLQIFERLAKREQTAYLDVATVLGILEVGREEKGDSE
ncbi:hypothetical protein [Coprococcus comes]|jgi:hypothetical protein|uniref:Uncharacterized protein n=1 Tax=Coprococcus comes TaxID=410072 RepID=A0A414QMI7_9FIRM|nr:hypothetical protein [Coprococcus comes]RHF82003.1 hypothetical protein DW656_12005 [Coprococcus comes]DAE90045.1 MAG TPA: RelB Antitoxin alpha helical domain [Caudoviricetes sp.]